nr:MAG TPA: C2H2 type zinc-finger protein [Caudoviricetes sp.]
MKKCPECNDVNNTATSLHKKMFAKSAKILKNFAS